ncbi:alpha/beta fold hydrolase [Embleya sp. NBC_00896]|uniref:alpha/beta fold hydrolase n=1 Tax=Embleya sp. NBC_00896 TaxID=2975961 RepID=UPI0038697746|nr:alpha/beta hydrolase [Embleya sp. NBC_00896]
MTAHAVLSVPGAELYYEVRGSGPMLLVSQSGEGGAGRSVDMVDRLVADFTVVTYDRRGLSRSTLVDPAVPVTVDAHADDVVRLLAELTDEPALMLGCSMGALIGLHVAARRPGVLGTLVAHEPVAPWLLPVGEQAHHRAELTELQVIHRRDGLGAALPIMAKTLGIDPVAGDREPDLTPQPLDARRVADFDFFIQREFTAIVEDFVDLAELRNSTTRIVPATGADTPRTVFDHRAAAELAALVGVELAIFPGGHNGNTSHPRVYAARLREVLGG